MRWVELANGVHDPATLVWLQGVARAVVEADAHSDANRRRLGLVQALGLSGRSGSTAAGVRSLAHALGADAWTDPTKRARLRELVCMFLLDRADLTDEALDARIRRALVDED